MRAMFSSPRAAALTFALLASAGCQHTSSGGSGGQRDDDQPRICTEMACFDQASITTKLSAAGAPLGTHEFALEIDGAAQTCTVDFEVETETADATCSGEGTSLRLGPAMRGIEMQMDGAVGYTEEPIPGEFEWQLSLSGTPKSVHVVHTHAGAPILDQKASFSYAELRPNGEGCEPVCQAASLDWTGP